MMAAASLISRMIRLYKKTASFSKAPSYVVHHVLTAALMHLLSSTSSQATVSHQAISRFRVCVEALEEMKVTWPRARKSVVLLQELAHRWSVVSALPMSLSYPVGFFPATDPHGIAPTSTTGENFDHHRDINRMAANGDVFPFDDDMTNFNWESTDDHFIGEVNIAGFDASVDLLGMTGLDWLFSMPNQ
jgi:hypothetical protein